MNRRTFLMGTVGTGLLAACGGSTSNSGGSSAAPLGSSTSEPAAMFAAFPDGLNSDSVMAAGTPQRFPFVLRDEVDIMRRLAPESVRMSVAFDGDEVVNLELSRHASGIITPYFPLVFTPPTPGRYVATLTDHPDVAPVPFDVIDRSEVLIPLLGDAMRPVDTPTFDNHRDVEPICTRAVPCPFHELNLFDLLDNGRPTVLVIATPGFCQTDICGPVVDLLIDAAPGRPDIDFVHAEVYTDPSVFQTGGFPDSTPAVLTNRLSFEPVLHAADAESTIKATLSTMWDSTDLDDAMAAV